MALLAFVLPMVVVLVFLVAPKVPHHLTPRRWHDRVLRGPHSWWYGGLLASIPLATTAVGAAGTSELPHTPSTVVGIAVIFGGPAAAVLLRSWRLSREHAYATVATAGPSLAALSGTPAHALYARTPLPGELSAARRERHGVDRAIRRAGTACAALAVTLFVIGRLLQVSPAHDEIPGAILMGILGVGVIALGLPLLLRWRARHVLDRQSLPPGAVITRNDTERLAVRFGDSPVLRVGPRGGQVISHFTVDGLAGERRWWATSQSGSWYDKDGRPQHGHASTWIVWLPEAALPAVVVRGRDGAALTEWFTSQIELESWAFNEAYLVSAPSKRAGVDVVTPRLMELVGKHLPDGAALGVAGELLFVSLDRRVHEDEVVGVAALALSAADLLPRYLLRATTTA